MIRPMTPAERRGRPIAACRSSLRGCHSWLAAIALCIATAAGIIGPAHVRAQVPEPYRDPPFTCTVIDYGAEPPTLPAPADDPLCVRYDKTNITVSTLEIVDFLAAEPGRVGVVAAKCSYWQQDHWIVRVAPDTPPLIEWEGSYWYDARTWYAAGVLRNLRVGGQPADTAGFIEALRPLVGDENADDLAAYADAGGGGGATFGLPNGFGVDCRTAPPADPPSDRPAQPGDSATPTTPDPGAEATSTSNRLPATGGGAPPELGLLALATWAAVRSVLRRVRSPLGRSGGGL